MARMSVSQTPVNDLLEQRIAERNASILTSETQESPPTAVDPHAEEKEKIRAVMGEKEWVANNGHICNDCAVEASSELRCRCTWKCKRHTLGPLYESTVARGATA